MRFRLSVPMCLLFLLLAPHALADERAELGKITFFTENYPPLNYEERGQPQGLSVDLLREIFNRLEVPFGPETSVVVPWARGYTETQVRKHSALFSTVRTPAREHLFKWVGPIGRSNIVLVARKDAGVMLDPPSRLGLYTFGVVQHDRGEQALLEAGVSPEKFVHMNSPLSAAHLLARGRVDMWAYERVVSYWVLHRLGYRVQDFEVAYTFERSQYYYAFNRDTDDRLIQLLQQTLDDIHREGTMTTIVESYIPGASAAFLAGFNSEP